MSSPVPSATPRRLLLAVTAAIIVLAAAELSARTLAPYLPEPLGYADTVTEAKVAQLDQRDGRCVDLVVAGNSMGRDAFDPTGFQASDPAGRSAYNASLDAASPALLHRWLIDEVIPRVHPATVVITLSSADFNANGRAVHAAIDAYDSAPRTEGGLNGALSTWFDDHSALVGYRESLRDPGDTGAAVQRWRSSNPTEPRSPAAVGNLIGDGGQGRSRLALHYRHDSATKSFTRQQLLADYELDPRQIAETRGLVEDLQSQQVQVALVVLPVTADYVSLHPNGAADFDRFLAETRSVASDLGVAWIDEHTDADEAAFADTHHLNATGQQRFSSSLPTALAAAGVPVRSCA